MHNCIGTGGFGDLAGPLDGRCPLPRVDAIVHLTVVNQKVDRQPALGAELKKREADAEDLHFADPIATALADLDVELKARVRRIDHKVAKARYSACELRLDSRTGAFQMSRRSSWSRAAKSANFVKIGSKARGRQRSRPGGLDIYP